MQRTLIIIGVILIMVGLIWPWLGKLGRLPGDLAIHRGNFKLYVPITTMLLISLVLSAVLWLFRK
jgi:Protein of unknown function (DUF2905)